MKKAIIALVVLIVIGFIPFQLQHTISIKANYFDVCQQLKLPTNWLKWQPGSVNQQNKKITLSPEFFIHTPQFEFKITNISANVFKVVPTAIGISYPSFYSVLPGTKNNSTEIVVDYKTNVFKWLISQFYSDIPANNLKAFMENAKLYYGFTIKEIQTNEEYMVVKKQSVSKQNKYLAINKIARELDSFITENHINVTAKISASYYAKKTDSLEIIVGMQVNKQSSAKNNVIFMRMPGGKVVTANYKGKYSDRQKIYTALEKYIQDRYLQKQVAPFERYLNNKLPSSDNDIVNMQVNYPVL